MFKLLHDLHKKEDIKILGLMSGTSADGLDIACVEFSGYDKYPAYKVLNKAFIPYPEEFSHSFKNPLQLSATRISELHFKLGKWYGDVISRLDFEYDVVANHGQTLLHQPPDFTLQIGEAQSIAEQCGKPVIYDFRTADVMLGGQGAPLIPILDAYLLRDDSKLTIALNMGGIANLTVLPPIGVSGPIRAWDTGPANTLIDKAVIDFTSGKENYDNCGHYAEQGKPDHTLLNKLMSHEYLKRNIPKSAGQEQFGLEFYESVKKNATLVSTSGWLNFIATLSEFTVLSICRDIKGVIGNYDLPLRIVASGGGAENNFIMKRIEEDLLECELVKFQLSGIGSDIKEAFGFAYLGYLFIRELPGNIPSVTGASRETVLGKIVI